MKRGPSFLMKQLILMLCGIVVIVFFFLLKPNKEWLNDRVLLYWQDFLVQRKKPDLEYRRVIRFEGYYTYSKQIADSLIGQSHKKDMLLLLPPTNYFKKYGIDYHVPEPSVFYYFTGIKTVWANSSNAADANWYLRVKNGKIIVERVADKKSLQDTITVFKKTGITI
jgi:hypothetical protein